MTEHYFSPTSATDAGRRPLRVRLEGSERDLVSAKGVFSGAGLDLATSVLLSRLDELAEVPRGGTIVDVGCGWGPIALTAALRHPDARVVAVDVSERAQQLTAENAERLGLTGIEVLAPEEVPEDLRADAIWSNPPIRIGKEELHALLLIWAGRLSDAGTMALVVGKNLGADPLRTWLAEQIRDREVRKAASAKGYRILEVGPRRT